MGTYFSDSVELALKYIFYDMRLGKGQEGFQLLEEASAAGDGDATCLLARCYCGYQYVWSYHGFPEDDDRAIELIHLAVEQGSALGVLVAMRMGELTPSVEKKMPFANLKEAFDIVLEKAERGEPFCQYMVGNVYFWWDFLRIEGKGRESFPNDTAFRLYLADNIMKCEDWYRKAYEGGVYFAGNNLRNFYLKGEEGLVPARPEMAKGIWRIGAEKGYPLHQQLWAEDLANDKNYEEALHWYKLSLEGGQLDSLFYIGKLYEFGDGVEKDTAYAAQCYEQVLNETNVSTGCHNRLGALLYKGDGVPKDDAKAFQYLTYAHSKGTNWGVYYLGEMCFYGYGTQQDYVAARQYLEEMDWNYWKASYLLGYIYGRGLGVPEDIEKAVALLQKAGNHDEPKAELLRYKKTLFGKWKKR